MGPDAHCHFSGHLVSWSRTTTTADLEGSDWQTAVTTIDPNSGRIDHSTGETRSIPFMNDAGNKQ